MSPAGPRRIPACASARASRTLRVLRMVLIACLLAASATAVLAPAAGAKPASELTRLAVQERGLERQIGELQTQLLYNEQGYEQLEADRDRALALLMNHLVQVYKDGDEDLGSLLLAARSVEDAWERGRLVERLTSYEQRLLGELDAAEERAREGQYASEQLMDEVVGAERRLLDVRIRMDVLRERQQARRDARPNPQAAGKSTLVSSAGAPGPINPDLVFSTSFGSPMGGGFGGGTFVPGTVGGGFTAGGGVPAGASASAIDSYLASKGSPMAGAGVFFMASGQRWGIDPRFVVAIAGAESNFGQVTCGPYNAWGWACPNSPATFASWADGIETITRGLRKGYADEGRTTVALVQQKYAPSGADNDPTGLNNNWVANVSRFLMEIGGNPGQIAENGSSSGTPAQ